MNFVSFWIISNLKKKHSIISCFLIVLLSFCLVTTALIFSKSMIVGMQDRLINLTSGHLTVYTPEEIGKNFGKSELDSYRVISGLCMLYTHDNSYSVIVKGIDDKYLENRSKYLELEKKSDIPDKSVIVSRTIATALNLEIGDKLAVLIVPDGFTKVIRPDVVSVSGIYSTGYAEIDDKLVFTNQDYAGRIFPSPDSVSTELVLRNYSLKELTNLKKQLNSYIIKDWTRVNYDVFRNLVSSNQVIFVILLLIVVVSSYFSFSVTQHILFENRYNISVCRILGADNRLIKKTVFLYISGTIVVASVIGFSVGLVLGSNLNVIIQTLNIDGAILSNYLLNFDTVIPWKSIFAMFVFQFCFSAFFIMLQLSGEKNTKLTGLFT